jgi:hypothetical protein
MLKTHTLFCFVLVAALAIGSVVHAEPYYIRPGDVIEIFEREEVERAL